MKTKIFDIHQLKPENSVELDYAAAVLRQGGLVAFPTETVYGLGADAMNPSAVGEIYKAKGRPSDNPLIVHISSVDGCLMLTDSQSPAISRLAEKFWPGPLTLVLPKKDKVPDITTGGLATVAVRMPDHPVALELIKRAGCPVAAPSANLSGRPSPTRGEHVVRDLNERVHVIIKSGDCSVGIESTVLDMTGEVPTILRPGILTPEALGEVLGVEVVIDPAVKNYSEDGQAPRAPGMKYTHYAPEAEMIILRGTEERVQVRMEEIQSEKEAEGQKVGLIVYGGETTFVKAAHDFFARLRELDDSGVDLILAAAISDKDSIGFAVMNRMLKSAGYKVIDV